MRPECAEPAPPVRCMAPNTLQHHTHAQPCTARLWSCSSTGSRGAAEWGARPNSSKKNPPRAAAVLQGHRGTRGGPSSSKKWANGPRPRAGKQRAKQEQKRLSDIQFKMARKEADAAGASTHACFRAPPPPLTPLIRDYTRGVSRRVSCKVLWSCGTKQP